MENAVISTSNASFDSMKYDVVILTEAKYIEPNEIDWYVDQVLTEDRLVCEALERKGLKVIKRDWADQEFDWTHTRSAIFRTTWDYFHRFSEFQVWLNEVANKTLLINDPKLIRWNVDKHYLADLQRRGVKVVESHFRDSANHKIEENLRSWCEQVGGDQWVLKPTVSGAGRHTYRLSSENIDQHEEIYSQLIRNEDLLLQPFQKKVMSMGELSLMILNGKYTHAVRKVAKAGDFRVQDDFGGSVLDHQASAEEIAFAEAAVRACDPFPVYARVDLLVDNQGDLAISELELIEPELWFRLCPEAADAIAEGVVEFLSKSR